MNLKTAIAAGLALAAAGGANAWLHGPVTLEDDAKIKSIVSKLELAAPKKARKVLVYSFCHGYPHSSAIVYGKRMLETVALERKAFSVDFTENAKHLCDPKTLAKYDAIVLNNCTHLSVKRTPGIDAALMGFVESGKGICAIHSAVDGFYDSEAVAGMLGGRFWGHPWHAGGTWKFRNELPGDPLNAGFAGEAAFARSDEIYQQSSPAYDRSKVKVLVSLDMTDEKTKAAGDAWKSGDNKNSRGRGLRDDGDFAVSWVKTHGAGRIFYTSFGHDKRTFLDPARSAHVVAGLQYALGDL